VRITLRDIDLDGVGRLGLRHGGQENQSADDQDQHNDEDCNSGHGGAFADPATRCIAPPVTDLTKRLDRPVVLVGLMGVGKSTVGRRLAKRLGLPFVDSDSEIEETVGLPWGELFERYGEQDYRDGERRLVARLMDGQIRVLATGGGVFVDPGTRKLLNERGITVWLDAPVDILHERTSRRDTRPLLKQGDPKATLEKLAKIEREACAEAHIHVKSGTGAHRDVVDKIIRALDDHLGKQNGG
jgi:shikimate kinase